MKKKVGVFILLFFTVFSISFATAIENPLEEKVEDLEEKVENVGGFIEDEDVRSEYLKKEWTERLEETKTGKILVKISDFLSKLSPLFKVVLGIEYSLSWNFFFAIAIWLIIFILILGPSDAIFSNKFSSISVAFIISSLVGISGSIRKLLDALNKLIESPVTILISIIVAIILMALSYVLGKTINDWIKKTKEKTKKEQIERAEEMILTEGKLYEKEMRRGGEGKRRSQFVKKKYVERYAQRYGENAAKKRFSKKK